MSVAFFCTAASSFSFLERDVYKRQAVAIYQKSQQDALYRDGLIQRFEFTVELSWKSLKEYLEDQGFVLAASSPRAVLKDAYAAGVIQDAERWNQILTARNITCLLYTSRCV